MDYMADGAFFNIWLLIYRVHNYRLISYLLHSYHQKPACEENKYPLLDAVAAEGYESLPDTPFLNFCR